MKNKFLFGIIILVVIIVGIFLLTRSKSTNNGLSTSQTPQTPQTANSIIINNFSFNPNTLTIKTGTTVTWINQDSVVHKIKSDTFNSPDLNQGDKFEFTFNTKGIFNYSCSIHPSMQGIINVN